MVRILFLIAFNRCYHKWFVQKKKKLPRATAESDACADLEVGRWGQGQGQGQGVRTPLQNHKNIRFSSNTGPGSLKNRKATKSAFNVGPSSARQRNVI